MKNHTYGLQRKLYIWGVCFKILGQGRQGGKMTQEGQKL